MAADDRTIQVSGVTFAELELEARKRRVGVDELADEFVRAGIAESSARSGTSLRDALDVLDAVSARMPEIDAARVVWDEREPLAAHAD